MKTGPVTRLTATKKMADVHFTRMHCGDLESKLISG